MVVMPQPGTCTHCERPAKAAAIVRVGPPRTDWSADPERGPTRDLSRCEVVRYCGVEHRP
jgi:hypothetical protein